MAFGFFKKKGADEKAEMSFIDHLDVLRKHFFRSPIAKFNTLIHSL